MSGAALDNPLVREYLRELETPFARLPAGQAGELREQITAHISDALSRDAADEQVAAVLARLGSPAELTAPRPLALGGPLVTAAVGDDVAVADRPYSRGGRQPRRSLRESVVAARISSAWRFRLDSYGP